MEQEQRHEGKREKTKTEIQTGKTARAQEQERQ